MPFARTQEGMIVLGDVFWGRVNSCRADRSVSFRVGGAAVALIIVRGGLMTYTSTTHTYPLPLPGRGIPLCLLESTSHEEEPWV